MASVGMLGRDPGWYQDPAPRNPTTPDTVRYWDGNGWTAQVRLANKRERQQWEAEAAARRHARRLELERLALEGDVEAQRILSGAAARLASGADDHLSGWGRRVAGYLIDSLCITMIGLLVSLPWLIEIGRNLGDFSDQVQAADAAGLPAPGVDVLLDGMLTPFLIIGVMNILVSLIFEVGFLRALQATPGHLLLSTRVRLVTSGGRLPWSTCFVRWFGKYGIAMICGGIYFLLDSLWPVWDPGKQALHDKMAKTQVVVR